MQNGSAAGVHQPSITPITVRHNSTSSVDFNSLDITSTPTHNSTMPETPTELRKILGWKQLLALGIGATIGAGIFVVTGIVAHDMTGPALFLSYILAACVCVLSALCYSEMTSIVPSAGSAYSYVEHVIGQPYAFLVGFDLILEYSLQTALVTKGFSQHFNQLFILTFNTPLPVYIRDSPYEYDPQTDTFIATGSYIDLPAFVIALCITTLIVYGVKKSNQFNAVVVAIKITAVLFVIFAGIPYIKGENFVPFAPYGVVNLSSIGTSNPVGIVAGSAVVFYAFLGFDSIACQAEDAENPKRDVPLAICLSVAISTLLYIAVCLVLVGMVPYTEIDTEAPVSKAFARAGLPAVEFFITLFACIGMLAVMLSFMLAQPRVCLSMSRDGFLPQRIYTVLHPKYATPYRSTILNGVMIACLAAWMPYQLIVRTVNIGTLYAFLVVCIAVIVLKYTKPLLHRPFKCPFNPYVPALGALANFGLMVQLDKLSWMRWAVWGCVGITYYYTFGRRNAAKLHPTRYQHLNENTAPPTDGDSLPHVELTPTTTKKFTPAMKTSRLGERDEKDATYILEDLDSPAHQMPIRPIVPSASGISSVLDDEVFSTTSDSQPPTPSPSTSIHQLKHHHKYKTDDNERNSLMPADMKASDDD